MCVTLFTSHDDDIGTGEMASSCQKSPFASLLHSAATSFHYRNGQRIVRCRLEAV